MKNLVNILRLLFSLCPNAIAATDAGTEIHGKIIAKVGACQNSQAQIFVSENKKNTLIYQVDTISGGSFFFRMKQGSYTFKAITQNGCEGKSIVTIDDVKPMTVEIHLFIKKEK